MLKRYGCALFTMLTMISIAGCSSSSDRDGPLISDIHSPIADVPMPAGFKMDKNEKESFSDVYGSSGLRFVRHLYSGGDNYMMVTKFYREQMPQKKWVFSYQTQEGETITLTYTKNNEDCIIVIKPTTFGTSVRVRIMPSPRATQ